MKWHSANVQRPLESEFAVRQKRDRQPFSTGVRFGGKCAGSQLSELLGWEAKTRVFVGFVDVHQSRKNSAGTRTCVLGAERFLFCFLLCLSVINREAGGR